MSVILGENGEYISGSKESVKEQGEVMTPEYIVNAMLNQIEDAWKDPTYVFLEPSCGTGNFLVEILERRIKALGNVEDALNTILAMDVNKETLEVARRRLLRIALRNTSGELLERFRAIVLNNIFWVEDSIAFLKNDGFAQKKFVYTDPTGDNCVMSDDERNAFLKGDTECSNG